MLRRTPWCRWRGVARTGITGLVLALAGLGVRAQESGNAQSASQSLPTLVFPSLSLAGGDGLSADADHFRATALRDLKESGAFRLLTPSRAPMAGDAAPGKTGRSDLMVRFVSHSLAKGKLLIESECINVATGAVVLKKSFMGQTAAVDRMAHRLADFLVGKVTGTPGVADSTVVFVRATAPGVQEIFGADRDGQNQRQLTSFGSLTTHPAVAGDGRLAFVTYKGGPPQVWGQIQSKGAFSLLYPKGSPAGMELSDLAWSPDGQRLGLVQATRKGLADIHVLDLATGQAVRLTDGGHINRKPSWSPDGASLAFLSDRDGASQVYVMASDGSRVRRLTADPAPKACVAWSAKGDRIAYGAQNNGETALFTMAPDGGARQQVATLPGAVASLCWAPDGRSLLVGVGTGPGAKLLIAGLDGKVRDFAGGMEGGQFPQWIQNPAPALARNTADHSLPYPVPALMGAAPLP